MCEAQQINFELLVQETKHPICTLTADPTNPRHGTDSWLRMVLVDNFGPRQALILDMSADVCGFCQFGPRSFNPKAKQKSIAFYCPDSRNDHFPACQGKDAEKLCCGTSFLILCCFLLQDGACTPQPSVSGALVD